MIKVAAITGGKTEATTRFRIRQHIKPLHNFGIEVQEYVPAIYRYAPTPTIAGIPKQPLNGIWQAAKLATRIPGVLGSWNSQITWLGREILPYRITLEPLLKKPLVFDVDDAIWLINSPRFSSSSEMGIRIAKSVRAIAQRADVVIAGNNYLAQWFADYASDIRIIPTAIDTSRFQPGAKQARENSDRFTIGWTGSADNLLYLNAIEAPLRDFLNQFNDAELLIIAERPPSFQLLPSDRVRYIPWSESVEVAAVQQMDVGLMPLPNKEWSKGKCSFKMIQYMACGKPVIVSPIAMNAEILAMGEVGIGAMQASDWYEALVLLYKNRQLGYDYGQKGRTIIEEHFSQKVVVEKLATLFKDVA